MSLAFHLADFLPLEADLPEAAEALPVLLFPRTLPVETLPAGAAFPTFFLSCQSRYFLNVSMLILSVVLVDFFPVGEGRAGVYFLEAVTDLLVEAVLPFWGDYFLVEVDLLGVYLAIFSAVFFTSPLVDSTDFLPAAAAFEVLAADLEAALALPLAPPLTLA
jgi:hypothetical protein